MASPILTAVGTRFKILSMVGAMVRANMRVNTPTNSRFMSTNIAIAHPLFAIAACSESNACPT
jgi:hypothetical protein